MNERFYIVDETSVCDRLEERTSVQCGSAVMARNYCDALNEADYFKVQGDQLAHLLQGGTLNLAQVTRSGLGEGVLIEQRHLAAQLAAWSEATHKEPFMCANCRKWRLRRKRVSNPKKICDDPKCKKISKLGHDKPVKFSDMDTGEPTIHTADIKYHGKPQ